jgi:hypothetical protein
MILELAITHVLTNFEAVRRRGVPPEVLVWIREDDENSCAKMAERILKALQPIIGEMKVTVESDPWIPRPQGKSKG